MAKREIIENAGRIVENTEIADVFLPTVWYKYLS